MRLLAWLFLMAGWVQAQHLLELLESANHNHELASKAHLIEAHIAAKEALVAGYYPRVEAALSHSRAHGVTSLEPKNISSATLKGTLVLFDAFKREGSIQGQEARIGEQRAGYAFAQERLHLLIVQEVLDYFSNQAEIKALEQKQSELEESIRRAHTLHRGGLLTLDVLEGLKAQHAQNLYVLHSYTTLASANLKLLGLYTATTIQSLEFTGFKEPTESTRPRDDVRVLEQQIEALRQEERQYRYLPSAMLELKTSALSYSEAQEALKSELPTEQSALSLMLTLPLYDHGMIQKQGESLRAQRHALEAQKRYLEEQVDTELAIKRMEREAQKSKIESALRYLASAEAAFENSKQRFEAGLIGYVEYLEGLSKKYDAQALVHHSRNQLERIHAELCYLGGIPMKECVR